MKRLRNLLLKRDGLTLSERLTVRLFCTPIALLSVLLWFFFDLHDKFGWLGVFLIVGLPNVAFFLLMLRYKKRKKDSS